MPPVMEVSRFLGVLALVAGPGALVLLALRNSPATAAVRAQALPLAAAVATTAMVGSLWYSEVAGFVPCTLCWYQRIPMYALAVILTVAAVRRDDAVRPYARVLAGIGLVISLWHIGVQRFPSLSSTASCSADAPCTATWVDVFGILTIPTMAACGFLAVLVLTSVRRPSDDSIDTGQSAGPTVASHGATPVSSLTE